MKKDLWWYAPQIYSPIFWFQFLLGLLVFIVVLPIVYIKEKLTK